MVLVCGGEGWVQKRAGVLFGSVGFFFHWRVDVSVGVFLLSVQIGRASCRERV